MMKKTLLFCFVAFAVYHSKAQYSFNPSFGNGSGYSYLFFLDGNQPIGNQDDFCRKLIKLPNGNILVVGSMRFQLNGDDLDYGYFEINAFGQDLNHHQFGTANDEYLEDALVLDNVLYFCGSSADASGFKSAMIGKVDLATNTTQIEIIPTSGQSYLSGITTDGTSLYYCGNSNESFNNEGFTLKTDQNLVTDNTYGFGGTNFTSFLSSSVHGEFFNDIIYLSDNTLLVAGYTMYNTNYAASLLKVNKTNGDGIPGFTSISASNVHTDYSFHSIAESLIDNSIVAVGGSQSYPAESTGIIGVYNLDGTVKHATVAHSCESLIDVTISNERIVATGYDGPEAFIVSRLLPNFSSDTDFNFTDGTDHFLTTVYSNSATLLRGETALIDGDIIYVGGSFSNLWVIGNTALGVSKYTSNGVGISENNVNTDFSVFPNPVADVLNIESKNQQVESIEIINQVGQVVKTSTNTSSINCSDLESGSYFIRVNKNEVSTFNKL